MTDRPTPGRLARDWLNFTLTNRLPRRSLTRLAGRLSKVEQPLVRGLSIAAWRTFCDVDLSDSGTNEFRSLHEAFTRPLRAGARPVDVDPGRLVSPCDGIVVACGPIDAGRLLQAKRHSYTLEELLVDERLSELFSGGSYVTLRLTAGMYHRFHAVHDCLVQGVTYVSGDVRNVNPPTLARVPRLYCRNERAVIHGCLAAGGDPVALVAVGAVLVASIRLHFADVRLHLRYRGPNEIPCAARLRKGEEMGWFEHGSTIIVLVPAGYSLCDGVCDSAILRMGQALVRIP